MTMKKTINEKVYGEQYCNVIDHDSKKNNGLLKAKLDATAACRTRKVSQVHIKNKRGHYFVCVTEALCPINSKKKLHQYWMTNKNPIYLPSMQNFRIWTHFWRERKIMAHQKPVMMIILQKKLH